MNYEGVKNEFGFTLLEVLISVAVVTVLAGISIPIYRSLEVRSDLDFAVNVIVGSLRRAQVLAQAAANDSSWGVNISQGAVTLFSGSDFLSRDSEWDEVFVISDTIAPSGLSQVTFGRFLGFPGVSGDVVLAALSGDTRTITISDRGIVNWGLPPALGDWASPSLESSVDFAGANDGWKVWAEGNFVYVVRLGGSPDFLVLNVAGAAGPVISSAIDLPGIPMNIFVSGNYAYVASGQNSAELQVVDVSNPALPSLIGTYDAPGGADGRGIYVQGENAFLVRASSGDNEFIAIDVSAPGAPTSLGSVNLGDTAREVVVLGSYAYVASHLNSAELQVVDVSNLASPQLAGSLDLTGISNGQTIAGFLGRAVLGRANGEVYLIDISSPAAPSVLGLVDTGDPINDFSLGGSNAYVFAATDTNGAEFQALDISGVTPGLLGTLNLPAGLNGVYYHSGKDRVYAVGDDNGAEFTVIAPQ